MTDRNIPVGQQIRKDFPDYELPSEAADRLLALSGTNIKQLSIGLLNSEQDDIGRPVPSSISSVYVLLEDQVAIEFRLDGQTGSLGVSFINEVSDEAELFQAIQKREDLFPKFFRTKRLTTVSSFDLTDGPISSVTAYKLPDNHDVRFAKSLYKNERIVCFEFEKSEDLLIVCRVTKSSYPAPQFIGWGEFPESFPRHLLETVF